MGRLSCLTAVVVTAIALLFCNAFVISAVAQSQNANRAQASQTPSPGGAAAAKPSAIPTPYETTLSNGLQVLIVEDHRQPLVNYRLAFRIGDANDPSETPGLAAVLADMLTQGTEARTAQQLSDEQSRTGAALAAGSNADYTTLAASAPTKAAEQALELLADIALRPSFPARELELIRQNRKQFLVHQRSQPSFLTNERLALALFAKHPYSRISTTAEALDAMTRDRLIAFHRAMFIPNQAVLVVVGDVQRDALMKRINDLFGKWAQAPVADQQFTAPPVREARAIYVVDRPGATQSSIVIANLGVTRASEDYFPLLVLQTILGSPVRGRLRANLRDAKGYTEAASSSLEARRNAGWFGSTADVRGVVTGASLKEFFYELERVRTEPVPEREVNTAKDFMTNIFSQQVAMTGGLMDQLVQLKMYGLPANYLQTYNERINAVTPQDIQRVAQQYILPDKSAVIIVGDAATIMEQLKPYAQTVELYDAAGRRKELSTVTASANTNTTTTPATTTTATPPATGSGSAAMLPGVWALQIQSPNGQTIPATLTITQDGGNLRGKVQTQMGDGSLSDVTLNGNNFDARLSFGAPGQAIDGKVTGSTESNERMSGTITLEVPNLPPLPFTGTRSR
ncbi:MAG TPA: pitrilysin family protein [Pyrinomonadaceae bacterium]|jgi:predicted Zn-dependent peptidase|nr:pitrilysin family protein [Pyrinomonadaceae bacterium]